MKVFPKLVLTKTAGRPFGDCKQKHTSQKVPATDSNQLMECMAAISASNTCKAASHCKGIHTSADKNHKTHHHIQVELQYPNLPNSRANSKRQEMVLHAGVGSQMDNFP